MNTHSNGLKNWFLMIPAFFLGCNSHQENSDEKKLENSNPNVILILADDLGYSDLGSFGSEINTPNLDRLAENGIRFTQTYNHGVCAPSRAALLTGAYAHQVGMVTGRREITNAITLGNMFKMAGYRTLWSGKHHGVQNPLDLGFDRYYGLNDGAANYFNPGDQRPGEGKPARKPWQYPRRWIKDGEIFEPYTPESSDFYKTDYFTNYALEWLGDHEEKKEPFFLYLAYTAPHDPLQAWPEDIEKYLGEYMEGYEEIRKRRFQRQKESGLLGDNHHLSDPTHRNWDSLTEEEKLIEDSTMAVYAAMIDNLDQNIGRVINKTEELGIDENTLILFASDNGAAHQVVSLEDSGPIGSITRWKSLGPDWANVANTPLRKSKVYSHEGGIRTPMIAHWPAGITDEGRIARDPVHFIDFMPTFAELAGVTYPESYNDKDIVPMQGISIAPVFQNDNISRGEPLFQQLRAGKALRDDQYKIVTWSDEEPPVDDWELYDFSTDAVEMNDLRNRKPDIMNELIDKHDNWMEKVSN